MKQCTQAIGQNKQAITTFNNIKLSDLDQNGKGQYIIGLAQSYLAEENNKKAQQTLVKHQNEKLNPADAQKVTMLLADICLEQGQHGKAYPLYQSLAQRSQRLAPKDRAKVYLSIGKISKAEKNYFNYSFGGLMIVISFTWNMMIHLINSLTIH